MLTCFILRSFKLSKGGICINKIFFLKESISFIITILGVFLGFLLSSYWYNRNKRKEKLNLDLKYIKLVHKELIANLNLLINCLQLLNKSLKEINLYKEKYDDINYNQDFSKETIDRCEQLIHTLNKKFNNFENEGLNSAYRAGINKILKISSLFKLYNSIEEYKFDLNHIYQISKDPSIKFIKPNMAYVKFIKKSQLLLETMIEYNVIMIKKLQNIKANTKEDLNLIKITYRIKIKSKSFIKNSYKSISSTIIKIKQIFHKND